MSDIRLSSQPLLTGSALCEGHGGELSLETDVVVLTFTDRSAALLARLLQRLDGASQVAELAQELAASPHELRALLEVLAEEHLVLDAAAALEARTGQEFLEAFFLECRFWSKAIFSQPFWKRVLSGHASERLIFGWGIEFYHFVEAANEYMAAGVAYCREGPEIREWIAKHYLEECDHSAIFLEGLVKSSLDRAQILSAPPLASTRALINFLNELAIADSISYAAAFGIMQPSREPIERGQVEQFYAQLTKQYGFAASMFEAFRQHALIDVDLHHESTVLGRICSRLPEITPDNARKAVMAARSVAEHFMFFFEGILDYYSGPLVQVPRRPANIFAIL